MHKELAPSSGTFLPASSGVDRLLDQGPELTIPSANQCEFAALWIRSRGLAQGNVGVGESMPLIWKLPLGDTGTPAGDVILRPKGEVDSVRRPNEKALELIAAEIAKIEAEAITR
jgi:hypothetical protein